MFLWQLRDMQNGMTFARTFIWGHCVIEVKNTTAQIAASSDISSKRQLLSFVHCYLHLQNKDSGYDEAMRIAFLHSNSALHWVIAHLCPFTLRRVGPARFRQQSRSGNVLNPRLKNHQGW